MTQKSDVDKNTTLAFADQATWKKWLHKNHASSPGLWMQLGKKDSGIKSVTYPEALDVALIYGWIDGLKKGHDEDTWLQRFTPRGPRSIWSKVNVGHIQRLTEAGLMQPAGLKAVEVAKANGNWDRAYAGSKTITVHADLQAALDKNAKAKKFFATLNATNRYAVLWRVDTAKKEETRARRIKDLVDMLARGETIH
jgi:uncharacterized protein YdeI (YjbR/CyaY-like superfamily)